jgi:DNA helicase-2/ATP-dependent DNA helicase PcrA
VAYLVDILSFCYTTQMTYLDGLNERQKEAVLTIDGPVSVLAGAGSGKTTVLTTRIYHLIRQGIAPDAILAVTFTNKAAREMRERVAKRLDTTGSLPFVATFHGLGREILQQYGESLGIPRFFTIFDRDDSEKAIKDALKALDVDPKELSPRFVLSRISKAKSDGITMQQFTDKYGRESFRSRIVAECWKRYEDALKKEKALDFDDLIALPVRLLENNEQIRRIVQNRFTHIHIDEYQDTNALQGRLAAVLAGETKNLFVVGDIDQTIYTWRGATIDNLLAFEEAYPGAKTIILEHNYRSTKTIVDASNGIIEMNKNRKEKRSVTDNPDGEKIVVHPENTAEKEGRYIALECKRLMREGNSPEEMAILFRTNFQSRVLEEAFLKAGVPYRLLGTRFFDRREVKDVLAWIRLALDPSRENDRARAVQTPPRGIGKVTLGKMIAGKSEEYKPSERTKIEAFNAVVTALASAAETEMPSLFVRMVIEKSGIEKLLASGGDDDQERLENVRELATLATRYDGMPGKEGISMLLTDASLASDQDELDNKQKATGVTLMTVHAAKGLEFDTVFVTGLEEGLFPHQGMDNEKRDEEEERRLFYVAITRAKKRLFLTFARIRRIYGTDYLSEPSNFLRDLDPVLTEYTDPTPEYDEYEEIIEA